MHMDDQTRVINLSQTQLRARREAILIMLGMTHREFVLKAMNDGLNDNERQYEKEIDTIDFLLKEDQVTDEKE
jgi:hypothetical protein